MRCPLFVLLLLVSTALIHKHEVRTRLGGCISFFSFCLASGLFWVWNVRAKHLYLPSVPSSINSNIELVYYDVIMNDDERSDV